MASRFRTLKSHTSTVTPVKPVPWRKWTVTSDVLVEEAGASADLTSSTAAVAPGVRT